MANFINLSLVLTKSWKVKYMYCVWKVPMIAVVISAAWSPEWRRCSLRRREVWGLTMQGIKMCSKDGGVKIRTGEWYINDSVQTRWRSGRWGGSVMNLWSTFNWWHSSLSSNAEIQIFMELRKKKEYIYKNRKLLLFVLILCGNWM